MSHNFFITRLKLLYSAPRLSLIGLFILLLCITISAYYYQAESTYSIGSHFISELGHSVDSPYYWVFSIGTIVAGFTTGYLILAMGSLLDSKLGWLFTIIGLISSAGCIAVGLFPANLFKMAHLYAALIFFWGSLLDCLIFVIILFYDASKKLPKWFILPSILMVVNTATFLALPRDQIRLFLMDQTNFVRPEFWYHPFFEWMVFFSVILWLICINSYLFLYNGNKNKLFA
jgi:hypothetical protein